MFISYFTTVFNFIDTVMHLFSWPHCNRHTINSLMMMMMMMMLMTMMPFFTWTSFSQYQNVSILDIIGAKVTGAVNGDNWSYKTCKAPVKSSPPTNQNPTYYRPEALLSPNQQCQSTEGKISHPMHLLTPSSPGGLPTLSVTTNREIQHLFGNSVRYFHAMWRLNKYELYDF